MKQKRILVISQYFYPEQFRINDICCEWVKRGYKVTVITGIPNYPDGKFYSGYGLRKKRREIWNGIEIIRLPLIPRGNTALGLMLNYVSFVISGFFWNIFTKENADFVFTFEVSPMTQALLGVWYAKKKKIPHYIYVQDLWPENVVEVTGIKNVKVIGLIDKMVDYIYSNSNRIFVTSPSFKKAIHNRKKKVDLMKIHYWPQYAEDFYKPQNNKCNGLIPKDETFKIAFTGNIGYAQGLQILPEAAKLLENRKVLFIIVGDGRYKDDFLEEIKKRNVSDKFLIIPRQPAEEIPNILGSCDATFISFKNTDLFKMTIPAKLQSYMACGMPIIASAEGETVRIIKEAGCGVCCKIGDAQALCDVIEKMMNENLEDMSFNSRKYFEDNFEKSKLMDEFESNFM